MLWGGVLQQACYSPWEFGEVREEALACAYRGYLSLEEPVCLGGRWWIAYALRARRYGRSAGAGVRARCGGT